nr:hypothetical protein [Tanacetum cinerariifolium]
MDLTGYEVPHVLVTCRSQQLEVEGEGDENVPLYYYITDNLTVQFGREKFCLVTDLKFGVENLAEYEDTESRIPFRRRVFPSNLDGEQITGTMVYKIIDSELFDRLDDDDAVSLCCLGILQLVLLGVEGKRSIPAWLLRLANDSLQVKLIRSPIRSLDILGRLRLGFWSLSELRRLYIIIVTIGILELLLGKKKESFWQPWLKGNLPAKRLTPDETEARSDWWIFCMAYFDGRIGVAERVPRHVRPSNKEPIIVSQHYGLSDLSQFSSKQGEQFHTHPNSSPFLSVRQRIGKHHGRHNMVLQIGKPRCRLKQVHQIGKAARRRSRPLLAFPSHPGTYNPNLQPSIKRQHDVAGLLNQNILNRGKREQRPRFYKRSPYMEQPATTVLPKQRGNKNKNNVNKANLPRLNLWSAFDDENKGGDDVAYLGGRFTGIT